MTKLAIARSRLILLSIGLLLLFGCAQPLAPVTDEEPPAMDEETYRLSVEGIMARQIQVLTDLDLEGVVENPEFPPEIEELLALSTEVDNLNPPASFSDFHASYLDACSPLRGGTLDLFMAWSKWKSGDYKEALEYFETAVDKLIAGYALIRNAQLVLEYPEL